MALLGIPGSGVGGPEAHLEAPPTFDPTSLQGLVSGLEKEEGPRMSLSKGIVQVGSRKCPGGKAWPLPSLQRTVEAGNREQGGSILPAGVYETLLGRKGNLEDTTALDCVLMPKEMDTHLCQLCT